MTLRKTSGSLVITSLGPTRTSEPYPAVSDNGLVYSLNLTVYVIGFFKCIWLSTPERLANHPEFGEGSPEGPRNV